MTDIFHEVEEDLRREKLDAIWKKYGSYAIGIGVAFMVILGGTLWYSDFRDQQRANRSDQFMAAVDLLEKGHRDQGLASLDAIIEDYDKGYAALALLRKGAELATAGDNKGAVAAYDQLASSGLGDELLRELAAVKAGWLLVEVADYATLQARLTELADKDSVWAAPAREVIAFGAYRDGRLAESRDIYTSIIQDPRAPAGVRGRSSEMLAIVMTKLGPEEAIPVVNEEDLGSHEGHDHESDTSEEGAEPQTN